MRCALLLPTFLEKKIPWTGRGNILPLGTLDAAGWARRPPILGVFPPLVGAGRGCGGVVRTDRTTSLQLCCWREGVVWTNQTTSSHGYRGSWMHRQGGRRALRDVRALACTAACCPCVAAGSAAYPPLSWFRPGPPTLVTWVTLGGGSKRGVLGWGWVCPKSGKD